MFSPDSVKLLKQGDLYKRGHLIKSWKARTFTLKSNGILTYSEKAEDRGTINIVRCTCTLVPESTYSRKWAWVVTPVNGVEYVLQAKSEAERREWVE
jgi:hypothetical protein